MSKNIITKSLNLSRWRDFLNFTFPVTLLGYAFGAKESGSPTDLVKLLIILAANILAMAFAFIINELEDADDDGKKIDIKLAKYLSAITIISSLFLYSLLGTNSMLSGILVLALSFLYSWKKVRLKAYPIVDVISHCLMLGGLIFLSAFFVQGNILYKAFPLFLTVTLVSAYGQFYNQVRDFEEDKKAGLKNTSILIGKNIATLCMYAAILAASLLIIYSFIKSLIPIWFIPVGLVIFITTTIFYKAKIQERDKKSGVPIVNIQSQFLITLSVLSLIYLLV